MANFVTSLRIIFSIAMLFCSAFSPEFYEFYLSAGFTDMIDGAIARKTHTESDFGSRLDTIADFVFIVASLVKLIPVLDISTWIYIWVVLTKKKGSTEVEPMERITRLELATFTLAR